MRENDEGLCHRQWWGIYLTFKGKECFPEFSTLRTAAGVFIHCQFLHMDRGLQGREKCLHALEVGRCYHEFIALRNGIRGGPTGCDVGAKRLFPTHCDNFPSLLPPLICSGWYL